MNKKMTILAVGAHADDIELGCGGSLAKWSAEGHRIVLYVATDSAYADPSGKPVRTAGQAEEEAKAAAAFLKARLIIGPFRCFELSCAEPLNASLVSLIGDVRPDRMLIPWEGDTHPDHRALAQAAVHASRHVPTVLAYRSNWYLGPDQFSPRVFVDIAQTIEEKVKLISLHSSENARTNGAWEAAVRHQAAIDGLAAGLALAEGFVPVKVLYS